MKILDSISNGAAWAAAGVFFVLSIVAAALAPQEAQLGAWVRLVIWHGMLKWAVISLVFVAGILAIAYLISKKDELLELAHALQLVLLPVWVVAVAIGAGAAKLVWGSWNLAERRMLMSVAFTMVAAIALIVELVLERKAATAVGVIVTALTMGVGLLWITYGPATADVHPASAVMSSTNPSFKIFAFMMLAGCIAWVAALAVPARRWLRKHAHEAGETVELAEAEA